MVARAQVVGVGEVVGDDPGLVVGDVLELPVAADVAQRPDALDAGALLLVDPQAGSVHPIADLGEPELVGVGHAPGGDEDGVRHDLARPGGPGGREVPRAVAALGRADLGAEPQVVALGRQLGEPPRDQVVLLAQQAATALEPGHLHAERVEDVGELRRHEAATDDRQAARQLLHAHDGVAGVDAELGGRLAQTVDGEHRDARARGHDDLVGRDGRAGAGVDLLGSDEPCAPVEHRDVRVLAPVLLAAGRDLVDPPREDPVAHLAPAHLRVAGEGRAEPVEVLRRGDDVGGVGVHLGGDAADVEAGAAEGAPLEDRDVLVGQLGGDERVARARADDDQVEVTVSHALEPRRAG